ncbi:MAG: hypothetical protein GY847_26115 [Proteobacteria bacterium]|nr:hypothetical protein [Pseudomonadota bacterium]
MSRLHRIIVPLRQEMCSTRHQPVWEQARKRHPVFRKYDSIEAMLAAMADESRRALGHKDILTRVLIAEYKRRSDSIWSSLLLVAYYPMLSRLRRRIYGKAISSDDLDQLVFSIFLQVLDRFSLQKKKRRTSLYLRQTTQKQVFKVVRDRQREKEEQRNLDELARMVGGLDPFDDLRSSQIRLDTNETARLLIRLSEGLIPQDRVEVVIATFLHKENLRSYVARTKDRYPEEDLERVYQRLKHQRRKTIKQLKDLLEDYYGSLLDTQTLCIDRSDETDEEPPYYSIDYWTEEVFQ